MIRLATKANEATLLGIFSRCLALGAVAEADWRLLQQNPAMPRKFYLLDNQAVLETGTSRPILCGVPLNGEEVEDFLRFEGAKSLESSGWTPPGWKEQPHLLMRRVPYSVGVGGEGEDPAGFDADPAPEEVMAVLESREPFSPPEARDAFYTNLCTKVNHGYADVVGLRDEGGKLVCTAGLYALRENEGYLGAVETLPGFEGRGYASALVDALSRRHPEKMITLLCEPELERFYRRMGFADTGDDACIATKPEED